MGAPTFGHLAGKHGPRATIRVALWFSVVSFILMGFIGRYFAGLIVSVVLMDLGIQIAKTPANYAHTAHALLVAHAG